LWGIFPAMTTKRIIANAVLIAIVSVLALAAPAAAAQPIDSSGMTGDWGYLPSDSEESPGGKCGYSAAHEDGFAYLRWIKVRAPRVAARDITGGVDQQKVSWRVIIQRSSGSGWVTIKKSDTRTFTAYDNTSSNHDPIKVYVKATNDENWRAVIRINWLRNGATEGWVKASMEYYGVKWTVGDPAYVFTDSCAGKAD
jgi:hypothetical protein